MWSEKCLLCQLYMFCSIDLFLQRKATSLPSKSLKQINSIHVGPTCYQPSFRVYSVMVGHKTTVGKVKRALQEVGVTQVATSEFCQGHTTRWGVAWTLEAAVVFPKSEALSRKKKPPFSCVLETDVATTVEKLQQLMKELQITYSTLKTNQELFAMEITAEKNTWSNSRKRRRQEKYKQSLSNDPNNSKELTSGVAQTDDNQAISVKSNDHNEVDHKQVSVSNAFTVVSNSTEIPTNEDDSQTSNSTQDNINRVDKNEKKRKICEDDEEKHSMSNLKKPKLENSSPQSTSNLRRDPFLCCSLLVKEDPKGSLVEVSWLRGGGGREAAHQVLHYFQNNFKTR